MIVALDRMWCQKPTHCVFHIHKVGVLLGGRDWERNEKFLGRLCHGHHVFSDSGREKRDVCCGALKGIHARVLGSSMIWLSIWKGSRILRSQVIFGTLRYIADGFIITTTFYSSQTMQGSTTTNTSSNTLS